MGGSRRGSREGNARRARRLRKTRKCLQRTGEGPKTRLEMPPSSRLCPFCRGLNSAEERRCYRCGRPLPGPLATGLIGFFQNLLGGDAVMTRILAGISLFVFALCVASDRTVPLWISHAFTNSTLVRFGALGGRLGEVEP